MRRYWPALVILAVVLLFAGNFHIFTGTRGMSVVQRVTPAMSEFIVNEDALRSMPPLIVAVKYPLSAMALLADDKREIDKARAIVNE